MRVSEGTSFELSDGTWLKPEVELEDVDFDRAMAEWSIHPSQVAQVPVTARYMIMSALARFMLAERQVAARMRDGTNWVEVVGIPQKEAVQQELSQLYGLVSGLPVKENSDG